MTLAERLATALARPLPPDVTMLPGDPMDDFPDRATAAAVLVAITDRAEPGVLLTLRTDTLLRHAGQVAFPGGRVDPGDADVVAAALREAHEEIDLPPTQVHVVGEADRYRTITGFEVTPVIGVVPPDLPLRAAPGEVAAIFEAPLAFLLDPASREWRDMPWRGSTRRVLELNWQGHRIWGATAAMIVNLSARLA